MWGVLVPPALLSTRVGAYRTVLALIAPASSPSGAAGSVSELASPLTLAFSVSDPYLSRVAARGTAAVRCWADLQALAATHRAGALLLAMHPTDCAAASPPAALAEDALALRWAAVRRCLEAADLADSACPSGVSRPSAAERSSMAMRMKALFHTPSPNAHAAGPRRAYP